MKYTDIKIAESTLSEAGAPRICAALRRAVQEIPTRGRRGWNIAWRAAQRHIAQYPEDEAEIRNCAGLPGDGGTGTGSGGGQGGGIGTGIGNGVGGADGKGGDGSGTAIGTGDGDTAGENPGSQAAGDAADAQAERDAAEAKAAS